MKVMDNHHKAMELADQADSAKQQGSNTEAKDLYFEAFKYERAAAMEFENQLEVEPTRSVLFRSAATLALECEKLEEAQEMIGRGLSGSPPEEIKNELQNLKIKHFPNAIIWNKNICFISNINPQSFKNSITPISNNSCGSGKNKTKKKSFYFHTQGVGSIQRRKSQNKPSHIIKDFFKSPTKNLKKVFKEAKKSIKEDK